MTVTDHAVLHETAERLASHPTTWAAPASTTSAAPGEPRPRSLTPAGRLTTPVAALPAWKAAGALPPVPAASLSTGGRGAVPRTAPAPGPSTTPADPAHGAKPTSLHLGSTASQGPAPRVGQGRLVPPDPHDPDRAITDWWDREPDPQSSRWIAVAWVGLAAALWALYILRGYDVWHLLGLRMPWAA